ncbi:MAG: helix-turn-helix domain-containing protein [Erythrobacter sp.]
MIETLDTAIRLVSIGASLLLLLLLLAGDVRRGIKVALAGLLLGAMAYLINSSSPLREVWQPLQLLDLLSLFVPFWIWLFARRLFEKEPAPIVLWPIAAISVVCWYAGNFLPWTRPFGFYIIHIIGLLLVVDLLRIAFTGRADDLIEKRRLIRLWLPILVALQSGGVLLFEVISGDAIQNQAVQLMNAVLIFALTLFSGLALLRTDPELLLMTEDKPPAPVTADQLSPSEQVLKEKLEAAMADGHYRTAGLTITGLADHLDSPEHRLRALINQRLGHRNFSAFLNQHRIAEAREILSDKAKVDLPVLTIAMDLGYNSLATFNRAFRTKTATTPSDYRRNAVSISTDQN